MKKIAAWILAVCLVFGLTACSQKENHVYVQNVSALSQMGGIAQCADKIYHIRDGQLRESEEEADHAQA